MAGSWIDLIDRPIEIEKVFASRAADIFVRNIIITDHFIINQLMHRFVAQVNI